MEDLKKSIWKTEAPKTVAKAVETVAEAEKKVEAKAKTTAKKATTTAKKATETAKKATETAKKAAATTAKKATTTAKKATATAKKASATATKTAKAATKTAAKKVEKVVEAKVKTNITLQLDGRSYTTEELNSIAKDVWKYDLNQKPADLKTVELYVKPEENQAYYVMNGEFQGSFFI
ncbi:MAG: DNA-binding protein [Lachnospiraceae bacterium]|jgi:membrane-bound lytic murein transglycosylase|nr:DNA-binding protein [Lachnospiraceae bacterium]